MVLARFTAYARGVSRRVVCGLFEVLVSAIAPTRRDTPKGCFHRNLNVGGPG